MLEVSRDILSNPMQLIGSDFRYLAVTDEAYFSKDLGIRLDTETFDAEKMATFYRSTTSLPMSMSRSCWSFRTRGRCRSMCSIRRNTSAAYGILRRSARCGIPTGLSAVFLAKLLRQAIQQNPVLSLFPLSAVRRALLQRHCRAAGRF